MSKPEAGNRDTARCLDAAPGHSFRPIAQPGRLDRPHGWAIIVGCS